MGEKRVNLFGTDGIRGVANEDLSAEIAFKLGRAVGKCLSGSGALGVGKDTRLSGDMLSCAILAGITSVGQDALDLGVITTPGLSYIVKQERLGGGVMVSASHNPAEYNGLKVFSPDGKKISDELEEAVSQMILGDGDRLSRPSIGRVLPGRFSTDSYIDFLRSVPKKDLGETRLVLDTANGAAFSIAKRVWRGLSGHVEVINDHPDGLNINRDCGSTHLKALSAKVSRAFGRYHAGFAFDGDGDRCIGVDEAGNVLDGDHIMAVSAIYLKEKGRLSKNAVVGTVMSNLGLEICLKSHGIDLIRTKVGDRYVLEEMEEGGFNLGGEQSGHIIFKDVHIAGDGILTSLFLTDIMAESGKPMSDLASLMKKVPQSLHNIQTQNPAAVASQKEVLEAAAKAQKDLGSRGRVLVRPSGTEPLVRVMVEADDSALVASCIKFLTGVIEKYI